MKGMQNGSESGWLTTEPIDVVQAVLLPLPPVYPSAPADERSQSVLQFVSDPVYQLK
jgi:hypothetical protein